MLDRGPPKVSGTTGRYIVVGMLFSTVAINYLDRSNLSIVIPNLQQEFGLSSIDTGWALAAFGWAYAFFQIPGGWLVNRAPLEILYPALLAAWSFATILLGFSEGLWSLVLLRLAIGALEAPAYPAINRIATTWFPEKERASAISLYTAGQFFGLAFLMPVLSWICITWNWRAVFYLTGFIGLVWALVLLLFYREPSAFRWSNRLEVEHIQRGGALVDLQNQISAPLTWRDLATVFSSARLWGLYLGQFAVTSTQWFFLTWYPTYLIKYRQLDLTTSAYFTAAPFVATFAGVLCAGLISDAALRRGVKLSTARKMPIVLGLGLSCLTIGANFTQSAANAVAFMTAAAFGNGLASIGWSLVATMAPPRLVGLTGGAFNFISNLSGIITPVLIGYLAQAGLFAIGISYISMVALVGILSYVGLVGQVERLKL